MTTYQPDYSRRYGIHYEATKNMSSKEVAAHMRKVIKQAKSDGLLTNKYDYSVRLRKSSMSVAIDIYVVVSDALIELRNNWVLENKPNYQHADKAWFEAKHQPLIELAATEALLYEIHRSYNYDGSDSITDYFDVRFYGSVAVVGQTQWNHYYK